MWFIHVSVLGQFSMELVKSRSNTNYLIPWCLGFSAYKIRTAMLTSVRAAVRIVKVRTLPVRGITWVWGPVDDHFWLVLSLSMFLFRSYEVSSPGAVANRLNLMTRRGFPKQRAGFIMSFFSTGVIFLEGSSPFWSGHWASKVLVALGQSEASCRICNQNCL